MVSTDSTLAKFGISEQACEFKGRESNLEEAQLSGKPKQGNQREELAWRHRLDNDSRRARIYFPSQGERAVKENPVISLLDVLCSKRDLD